MRTLVLVLTLASLTPLAAEAQKLTLTMRDGLVTLDATDVPLRQVLDEWARIGDVTIVNADKVIGTTVTLMMPDVPERRALDALLRGVSGYMLTARPTGSAGLSAYDRILILPTSSVPPPVARPTMAQSPAVQPTPRTGLPGLGLPGQRIPRNMAPGMTLPNQTPDPDDGPFPDDVPSDQPRLAPGAVFATPIGLGRSNEPPQAESTGAAPTTPGNPFGTPVGSGRPGVVTPVPSPPPNQVNAPRLPTNLETSPR